MDLLHPKIVHLPIALAVLMPLLTAGLTLAWWRGWLQRRAWVLAIAFQVILVASSWLAMETGETDEERVEAVVQEQYIEAHEEAAEVFTWSATGMLVLFLLPSVIRKNERAALTLAAVAVAGSFVVLALGYQVGEAGGALVYEHGAANAFIRNAPTAPGSAPIEGGEDEYEEDDDD